MHKKGFKLKAVKIILKKLAITKQMAPKNKTLLICFTRIGETPIMTTKIYTFNKLWSLLLKGNNNKTKRDKKKAANAE